MKKCRYCQYENQDDALICGNCLRPLTSETTSEEPVEIKRRNDKLLKFSSCGSENNLNNSYSDNYHSNLHGFSNGSKKPSSSAKNRFLIFDTISIFLLGGIAYLYSLPVYPSQSVQLAIWNGETDVILYMYSELISSIALIAAFFLSAISLFFLRNHPRLSGFLWLIIAVGISAFPIIALIQLANLSSFAYLQFNEAFLNILLLTSPIFLFSIVRMMYKRNNQ